MRHLSIFAIIITGLLLALPVTAQQLRTSYFMEGVSGRTQLNPALHPNQGYINIPAIGSLHVSALSNTFGVKDIYEIIDSDDKVLQNDNLFSKLKDANRLNVNLNTDIISFGFYKGKGFWTGNIGLRADINASIPKSMLEYARYIDNTDLESIINNTGTNRFDIQNQSLNANIYTEIGVGYSRQLNDKLTIGAKAKVLLGVGNLSMQIDKLYIEEGWVSDYEYHAKVQTDAKLDVSMKGLELETDYNDDGKEYISDIDDFNKFGIAGYGFGFDVGATYQVLNNFTLSAAVLDLGFISWSKSATQSATSNTNRDSDDMIGNGDIFDFDLLEYTLEDTRSRSTTLASTMVLGAEYGFLNNQLSAGLLSTTYFAKPKTLTEITVSGNYRPKSWFNATLSYSFIQSAMKTFGVGMKIGPLFIGTDYMFFGNDSGSKAVNAYLGISIPLGKNKQNKSIFL